MTPDSTPGEQLQLFDMAAEALRSNPHPEPIPSPDKELSLRPPQEKPIDPGTRLTGRPRHTIHRHLPTEGQHDQALSIVQELFARHPIRAVPVVEWRRFRTTAGVASFERNAIGLNASMLGEDERLRSTIIHEYAHLLAFFRAGRKGRDHGEAWKAAMRDLGASPQVKHRYDCDRNAPRQVVYYRCGRCGTQLTRRRRLPKGRLYQHIGCGGVVVFDRIERISR